MRNSIKILIGVEAFCILALIFFLVTSEKLTNRQREELDSLKTVCVNQQNDIDSLRVFHNLAIKTSERTLEMLHECQSQNGAESGNVIQEIYLNE